METDSLCELREVGLYYSELWDIVNSKKYANIVNESGDGGDTSNSISYKKSMKKRDISGNKNPMYGRSAISENSLRWYNNGSEEIYVNSSNVPPNFVSGRIYSKRKPCSEKTRSKISKTNTGRTAPNRLKVTSPEGISYSSIKLAAESENLTVSQFRHRCVKHGNWTIHQ